MIVCGAVLGAPRFLVCTMNNPTPENPPETEAPAAQPQTFDPRRRLRELLSIPERDRTDEQWDEIIELEIQTAPGNRISPNEQLGGGVPGRNQGKSGAGQGPKKHRQQRPGGGSGGGGGGGNRRPRQNKQQSGGGNSGGAAPAAS